MRKLLVKDLHPGMITAEDIFSIDGQLILPKKSSSHKTESKNWKPLQFTPSVSKTKKLHRRRPVFLTRRPIVNVSNQIPILSILKRVLKIMWNPCRQD